MWMRAIFLMHGLSFVVCIHGIYILGGSSSRACPRYLDVPQPSMLERLFWGLFIFIFPSRLPSLLTNGHGLGAAAQKTREKN